MENQDRGKVIIRTSIVGIIANIFLAAVKAAIGLFSNSIAIILDAVNNLSDALSSVVTIIGAKLAGRKPDREHPLGHGRVEYVKKIIEPSAPSYKTVSLVIIAIAIVVKILLGRYVKRQGEKVDSGSLIASGADAIFDAVLSASVLASALIFIWTGVSLEAYVGVLISLFIIKAGIEMMKETYDDILGHRADAELSKKIKRILNEEPEVRGAFDLFINNYGPGKDYASVHLELPDTMTVEEVDVLTRRVQMKVFKETGVILTGVGVYSFNTSDDEASRIRNNIQSLVLNHEWALQMHGFFADTDEKTIRFDVVMSFDIDHGEGLDIICKEVKEAYPDYDIHIVPDIDITD